MPRSQPPRWRLNPVCRLHWRHWDEDHILFNEASGQTHYLNELGTCILELVEEEPLTTLELGENLRAIYGLEMDEGLRAGLLKLVAELDGLGLIEPA